MDEMETYREIIKENIDYPLLLREYPCEKELVDGYIELMVEVCCTRREFTRINQSDVPTEVVKSHFLKLSHEDIGCVLDCMEKNTTKIKHMKAYMLTTLYNAPMLSSQYFRSLASHDIAQGLV